jgi:hypothetical protein
MLDNLTQVETSDKIIEEGFRAQRQEHKAHALTNLQLASELESYDPTAAAACREVARASQFMSLYVTHLESSRFQVTSEMLETLQRMVGTVQAKVQPIPLTKAKETEPVEEESFDSNRIKNLSRKPSANGTH